MRYLGQQSLVLDQDYELAGQHRGDQNAERGEQERPLPHLVHEVTQSDRCGQHQRQVRQPQPDPGRDLRTRLARLVPNRCRRLPDAGQRRQRHQSEAGHSGQVDQLAGVIAAASGLEHDHDVGAADNSDPGG